LLEDILSKPPVWLQNVHRVQQRVFGTFKPKFLDLSNTTRRPFLQQHILSNRLVGCCKNLLQIRKYVLQATSIIQYGLSPLKNHSLSTTSARTSPPPNLAASLLSPRGRRSVIGEQHQAPSLVRYLRLIPPLARKRRADVSKGWPDHRFTFVYHEIPVQPRWIWCNSDLKFPFYHLLQPHNPCFSCRCWQAARWCMHAAIWARCRAVINTTTQLWAFALPPTDDSFCHCASVLGFDD
jgi:hypothetical protein